MKTAIALRHVAFEDLGSWEKPISKRYVMQYVNPADGDLSLLKNDEIDLLIVLGGPIGVYQEEEYPFIKEEISLIANRLKADLPTLGICLGSQLMARALGSKVYPNKIKEIGWQPLTLSEKGKKSCIESLSASYTSMFHWHGDTFDLPRDANLLASTEHCQNQIFSWKKNGLAFQCHPEVTSQGLEHWWVGHASELSSEKISVNELRIKSAKLTTALEKQSLKCLESWLSSIY